MNWFDTIGPAVLVIGGIFIMGMWTGQRRRVYRPRPKAEGRIYRARTGGRRPMPSDRPPGPPPPGGGGVAPRRVVVEHRFRFR